MGKKLTAGDNQYGLKYFSPSFLLQNVPVPNMSNLRMSKDIRVVHTFCISKEPYIIQMKGA